MNIKQKLKLRNRRKARTRVKISGTAGRPRLSVFRSHKHIYAQVIDDEKGITLISASDTSLKIKDGALQRAVLVGEELAKKTIKLGIKEVKFDKGSYKYHGQIKALAEGARKGGLVM